MLGIKVRKDYAERIRKALVEEGLLKKGYKPFSTGSHVFFPVNGIPPKDIGPFEVVDVSFQKAGRRTSLREVLEEKGIAAHSVLRAFDLIGNVAIVEIPEELKGYEEEIGKSIMEVHPNVKAVYAKDSAMEGEFRVRKLKLIAGSDVDVAEYKESGVRMEIPVKEVFFSPRLSYERKRIASLVKKGERVLVLFAGVGPFPLVIGKNSLAKEVVGVELNPKAVEAFRKNISLNKLSHVKAVLGDAKDALKLVGCCWDRVVMPLPKDAHHFLSVAESVVKDKGIIHIYLFVNRFDASRDAVHKILSNLSPGTGVKILGIRKVREYSPDVVQVVVDFKFYKGLPLLPQRH